MKEDKAYPQVFFNHTMGYLGFGAKKWEVDEGVPEYPRGYGRTRCRMVWVSVLLVLPLFGTIVCERNHNLLCAHYRQLIIIRAWTATLR